MADELRKCALGHEPRLLGPSKHLNSKYGMWVCCSWPNNETHEITQADGSYLYGTEYRTIRLPKPPGGAG